MQTVLIIGATSAIATATARAFARRGDRLYLVGRDRDKLDQVAQDLTVRGAGAVQCAVWDLADTAAHPALIDEAVAALGGVDIVLIAHGTLPDQAACEADFQVAVTELAINLTGTLSLLTHLANVMAAAGSGTLAVITSVAGDRGRQSNYLYGAAKGGVALFLQGLRNRLHGSGVQVLTIKPGFVDTPMTAHLPKGGPLWATPEQIATGIMKAIAKGRDVVYLPGFWRPIMWVIRLLPEALFKRMSL